MSNLVRKRDAPILVCQLLRFRGNNVLCNTTLNSLAEEAAVPRHYAPAIAFLSEGGDLCQIQNLYWQGM